MLLGDKCEQATYSVQIGLAMINAVQTVLIAWLAARARRKDAAEHRQKNGDSHSG